MKTKLPVALLLFWFGFADAQKQITLTSPDKQIRFAFSVAASSPQYDVFYKNRPVIAAAGMALSFSGDGEFKKHLSAEKPVFKTGVAHYEMITGKKRLVNDHYNEVLIPLYDKNRPGRKVEVRVRAFNDGLAFRYEFPPQQGSSTLSLTDEHSSFRFAGDPQVLALLLPNFTSSHEGEYTKTRLSNLQEDTLMDMPVLFELPGNLFVAITEANLLDYAGMYLVKHDGVLQSRLSPLPGENNICVQANYPHQSPWRVMMIAGNPGDLLESTILTSLSEPCRINDLSWIKPGKTTFPWWNGNVMPDTINAPGNNFVSNKYYIDFCARNNIRYHSVVEYGLHQWYTDDGVGFQPGPNADVTKPVPGLDMKEVCDYAKKLGVDVRVWVHWAALYPKIDSAFAIFERWGLAGMMIDFMDRDDQEMVNIQTEMLEKAAKHHLHVQFHGAYKPTGLSRTYPNEFTREGTLNYEVNKWEKRITPDHDLDICFTRLLAGSTDYHLGGFRAVPDSLFRVQYTRPLMLGTRCHQLAMYVVLENPLAMVCDYPEAYEGQPGFDFISNVPTTWDETEVLAAKLSGYLCIARRKGSDWFVGIINNSEAREIPLAINLPGDGNYLFDLYSDAKEVNVDPNRLVQTAGSVNAGDTIKVSLAAGGGAVIHLKRK